MAVARAATVRGAAVDLTLSNQSVLSLVVVTVDPGFQARAKVVTSSTSSTNTYSQGTTNVPLAGSVNEVHLAAWPV